MAPHAARPFGRAQQYRHGFVGRADRHPDVVRKAVGLGPKS